MATIGCDLASVDEDGTPDWKKSASLGHLRFVGIRASEGQTPDPLYRSYRKQLDDLGIANFPYLFLTPGLTTPEGQVDLALELTHPLDENHFPIAIDVEGDRRGLSASDWKAWVVRASSRIQSAIGVPPLIYTSRTYWADPDGMDDLPAPELVDCLGWWKSWPYHVRSEAVYDASAVDRISAPPAPSPWGDQWGIHQYQGDAVGFPGFRSTVDMDRIHVMRRGDRGDTVKWAQRRLGLVADGVFGPATEGAVLSFQLSRGLAADGVIGLDTLQRLSWGTPSGRRSPVRF